MGDVGKLRDLSGMGGARADRLRPCGVRRRPGCRGVLAAPALAAGRVPFIDRTAAALIPPAGEALARRLRLWIPLFVAAGNGAARLAWPEATGWALVAIAAAFAATRLAKNSPDVGSLARFPAAITASAAIALQAALQFSDHAMGGHEFGSLLLASGLVAVVIDAPRSL